MSAAEIASGAEEGGRRRRRGGDLEAVCLLCRHLGREPLAAALELLVLAHCVTTPAKLIVDGNPAQLSTFERQWGLHVVDGKHLEPQIVVCVQQSPSNKSLACLADGGSATHRETSSRRSGNVYRRVLAPGLRVRRVVKNNCKRSTNMPVTLVSPNPQCTKKLPLGKRLPRTGRNSYDVVASASSFAYKTIENRTLCGYMYYYEYPVLPRGFMRAHLGQPDGDPCALNMDFT
eukprot:650371-Rhodomonas_salina.1